VPASVQARTTSRITHIVSRGRLPRHPPRSIGFPASCRAITFDDLPAPKRERDTRRREKLRELTRASQELGLNQTKSKVGTTYEPWETAPLPPCFGLVWQPGSSRFSRKTRDHLAASKTAVSQAGLVNQISGEPWTPPRCMACLSLSLAANAFAASIVAKS
jgi:hypothetical protein